MRAIFAKWIGKHILKQEVLLETVVFYRQTFSIWGLHHRFELLLDSLQISCPHIFDLLLGEFVASFYCIPCSHFSTQSLILSNLAYCFSFAIHFLLWEFPFLIVDFPSALYVDSIFYLLSLLDLFFSFFLKDHFFVEFTDILADYFTNDFS